MYAQVDETYDVGSTMVVDVLDGRLGASGPGPELPRDSAFCFCFCACFTPAEGPQDVDPASSPTA